MEAEFEEKTLEDAIALAVATLGLTKDQFDVEVLESQRGLFGGKKVKIKVRTLGSVSPTAETDYEHAVLDFVRGLIQHMAMKGDVEIKERSEEALYINIDSEDAPILIGRKGAMLDSIQRIVDAVSRNLGPEQRVFVDVEEYRARREEQLTGTARKIAERVRKTKKLHTLHLMPPHERRIVHRAVTAVRGVSTKSLGEDGDYYKQVQLFPQ